jgi:hypothetical protein
LERSASNSGKESRITLASFSECLTTLRIAAKQKNQAIPNFGGSHAPAFEVGSASDTPTMKEAVADDILLTMKDEGTA